MPRAFFAAVFLFAASAAPAAVFHVTNLDDSATGSLRWAVDQANHSGGADQIVFDVAGTIHAASPIMTTEQVFIDANGAITLAGEGASPAALILNGVVARVRGLSVSNTGGAGIILRGDGGWVESCHVGPNSGDGVRIEGTNGSVTATTIVNSLTGIAIEAAYGTAIYGSSIDGSRADGIHMDAQSDTAYIGGVRTTCTNNCAGFVKPQNIISNSHDAGLRIEGTAAHVIWNQVVDNGGDGILVAATGGGEIIDNWVARNGGNGITILGNAASVLANSGTCNHDLLLDYGGDGPSVPDAPALQGAPNAPKLTAAARDVNTTSISGRIDDGAALTTYVVAFHPQQSENCPIEEQPFDWNPDTISVQTDVNGHATFNVVVPAHDENAILATMTTAGGKKMSEPSATIAVLATLFRNTDVAVSTVLTTQSNGSNIILTFTTTVTNRGPAAARDVVVTFTQPELPVAPPTDTVGSIATLGNLVADTSVVLQQSYLWPVGSGIVRYEARVTHDGGADTNPANDVSAVSYPPTRRRAVR